MQDRYVGGVGDFVKYGLLRAIRGLTSERPADGTTIRARGSGATPLRVALYLHPDAGRSGDGGHTAYFRNRDEWRHLDPKLFDTLTMLTNVGGRRTVEAFVPDRLDVTKIRVPKRERWRHRWFRCVQDQLADRDIVFADPTTGRYRTIASDQRDRPRRRAYRSTEAAERAPLS